MELIKQPVSRMACLNDFPLGLFEFRRFDGLNLPLPNMILVGLFGEFVGEVSHVISIVAISWLIGLYMFYFFAKSIQSFTGGPEISSMTNDTGKSSNRTKLSNEVVRIPIGCNILFQSINGIVFRAKS